MLQYKLFDNLYSNGIKITISIEGWRESFRISALLETTTIKRGICCLILVQPNLNFIFVTFSEQISMGTMNHIRSTLLLGLIFCKVIMKINLLYYNELNVQSVKIEIYYINLLDKYNFMMTNRDHNLWLFDLHSMVGWCRKDWIVL